MSILEEYNGTTTEILTKLINAQLTTERRLELFHTALKASHNSLISALIQHAKQNNYPEINFLHAYGSQGIKDGLELLINHFSLNTILDSVLHKSVVAHYSQKEMGSNDYEVILIDAKDIDIQSQLIDILLKQGADINRINLSSVDINTIYQHKELILDHSSDTLLIMALNAQVTIYDFVSSHFIIAQEKLDLQTQLIDEAIEKGADFNAILKDSTQINLSTLLTHKDKISPDTLLIKALKAHITKRDSVTNSDIIDQEQLDLQTQVIAVALERGANVNAIDLNDLQLHPKILLTNKDLLLQFAPEKLVCFALKIIPWHSVDYQIITNQEALDSKKPLIEYAISKGADLSIRFDDEDSLGHSLIDMLFIEADFENIDLALKVRPDHSYKISVMGYISGIFSNTHIDFIANAIKRFSDSFSANETFDLFRAYGQSLSTAYGFIDFYNLAKDFVDIEINPGKLSALELTLIDQDREALSLESYRNANIINTYGFSPLSLALLGNKLELAIQMIEAEFSLLEKSNHGITPLQLIQVLDEEPDADQKELFSQLRAITIKHLDNVDIIVNDSGESVVDSFLKDQHLRDEVLQRSNDPLYYFFKQDADLFALSKQLEKTQIAISHGEDFWSTGVQAWSRLATKSHPELEFHLVTLEMIAKGGAAFIKQFDGWINPGAGDYYPKDKSEFTKKDWAQSIVIEQTYQKVLDETLAYKIPYIGMCAGAQNLVLYHDGALYPLKNYNQGQHQVYYLESTLSHFMAMTKAQQEIALRNCDFPRITFKGDTAHHYAAVTYKLGNDMQLGAISEDGVAMSYAHISGLRYATQFHPEHHYHFPSDPINHEHVWLENFIDITILHSKHRTGQGEHPEILFHHIQERLHQCFESPTSLAGETIFSNTTALDMWLKH